MRALHRHSTKKGDVICPACRAGFRGIELLSRSGSARDVRCPLCDALLEIVDGSTEIVYRLTVAPEKLFA
jgi:C4-type Zn-finger protein